MHPNEANVNAGVAVFHAPKVERFAAIMIGKLTVDGRDDFHISLTCDNVPVKCNFITISIFNVLVQQVEAQICRGAFHPFYVNVALVEVKVVGEKLVIGRWCLPVKLLGYFTPKCLGIINRPGKLIELLNNGQFWVNSYHETG